MDSLIHSLRDITIRRISVSGMDNNVYLLTAKASGAQLLIDAADDLPAIQAMLAESAADTTATPKLALIATTHQHWDHVRALPGLVEATGAKTSAGVEDAAALPVPVDVLLEHGDVGTFRARSPTCTGTRTARRTSSAATRCSRAAWATRAMTPRASPRCWTM